LNLRPPAPEAGALPGCAITQFTKHRPLYLLSHFDSMPGHFLVCRLSRVAVLDSIGTQGHQGRAQQFKAGMSISQMIEEEREIVSFAECDSRFLQQCFQVFFGALLGVKAGCIVIGSGARGGLWPDRLLPSGSTQW
jgi:hypothetical protein